VNAADVRAGEHVAALRALLRRCTEPDLCIAPLPAELRLAAAVYELSKTLSLRSPLTLVGAGAGVGATQLRYAGEGCALELRAPGITVRSLAVRGGAGSLRCHKGATGVLVEGCALQGRVEVKKGAEAALRLCDMGQQFVNVIQGTLNHGHAVVVEGVATLSGCRVNDSAARGVSASGAKAELTIEADAGAATAAAAVEAAGGAAVQATPVPWTITFCKAHGVFANEGAQVKLTGPGIVGGNQGCGVAASGRRSRVTVTAEVMVGELGVDQVEVGGAWPNGRGAYWESAGGTVMVPAGQRERVHVG